MIQPMREPVEWIHEERGGISVISNMESKRSKRNVFEITYDILTTAREGAGRTRILRQANLSYKLLDKYLEKLLRLGLVAKDDRGSGRYKLAEKGSLFLEYFEDFKVAEKSYSRSRASLERLVTPEA